MRRASLWIFGLLYAAVATISTVHSVDMFGLVTGQWMAVATSCAFELGAAACLASAVVGAATGWTWSLFGLVTAMQVLGNVYSAFHGATDYSDWSALLGISGQDPVVQRRLLACVTGGTLPLVALGFVRQLSDLVRGPVAARAAESSRPDAGNPHGESQIDTSSPEQSAFDLKASMHG